MDFDDLEREEASRGVEYESFSRQLAKLRGADGRGARGSCNAKRLSSPTPAAVWATPPGWPTKAPAARVESSCHAQHVVLGTSLTAVRAPAVTPSHVGFAFSAVPEANTDARGIGRSKHSGKSLPDAKLATISTSPDLRTAQPPSQDLAKVAVATLAGQGGWKDAHPSLHKVGSADEHVAAAAAQQPSTLTMASVLSNGTRYPAKADGSFWNLPECVQPPQELERDELLELHVCAALSGDLLPAVSLPSLSTIGRLRQVITTQAGPGGGATELVFGQKVLADDQISLFSAGLYSGSLIHVIRRPLRRSATLSEAGEVRIWSLTDGECLNILEASGSVLSINFSPDGQYVLTASRNHSASIWKTESGELVATMVGHAASVRSATFSANGSRVVTASDDGTAKVWHARKATCIQTLSSGSSQVLYALFSPDAKAVLTTSADGTVRRWSTQSGKCLQTVQGNSRAAASAAFSPDGHSILIPSGRCTQLWSARWGSLMQTLRGHRREVLFAAFAPDGAAVVTASLDTTALIWSLDQGPEAAPAFTLTLAHESGVRLAAFSPSGRLVMTACLEGLVRIWSAADGQMACQLEGHAGFVLTAEFSIDSELVMTASDDATAKLWNSSTGDCLQTLAGHADAVSQARLSPA